MNRIMRWSGAAFVVLMYGMIASSHAVAAQIRPLEPPVFRGFDGDANIFVTAGVSSLSGQRASLAGTRGTLQELGLYSITWRTGRVALRASGTAIMRMHDEVVVEPAMPGVGAKHSDAGPIVLETSARLTPSAAPVLWLLRFGMQLPVTSFVSGLERDEADVFATLALRTQGTLWVAGEAGTGINGKPEPLLGQTDVVTYSLGAGYRGTGIPITPEAWIVGRDDLHRRRYRGNEDLRELRVSARTRGHYWLSAEWIHGLTEFSPDNGIRLAVGADAHFAHVPLLGWQ